jgi:hypothetical protein
VVSYLKWQLLVSTCPAVNHNALYSRVQLVNDGGMAGVVVVTLAPILPYRGAEAKIQRQRQLSLKMQVGDAALHAPTEAGTGYK